MQRESMDYDVLIVGGGPAGLAAACRLRQLAVEHGRELSVCLIEKGSELGAHIVSGAVIEPRALDELFPDWKERQCPLRTPVSEDRLYLLGRRRHLRFPGPLVPRTMHNRGNYAGSLGAVCRWLGKQAEELGVEVYPGISAAQLCHGEDGSVRGVITGDQGVGADGQKKTSYTPGMELRASYTLLAEGCRGHLGKELISRFALDRGRQPQHYAIGIKEVWETEPQRHQPGLVIHTMGWPLSETGTAGGSFLYHFDENLISIGLIVDLNYRNPHLSPFDEFQRHKLHPLIRTHLEGGKRIGYGARAITKGGLQSLPQMHFPGGLLIGCNAGTLNFAKIKGSHTAMKSGMIAAQTVFDALCAGRKHDELAEFATAFHSSWLHEELHQQRNFGPAQHRLGRWLGPAFAFIDLNIARGRTMRSCRKPAAASRSTTPNLTA